MRSLDRTLLPMSPGSEVREAPSAPVPSTMPPQAAQILDLQQGVGNAAVARMLLASTAQLQRRTELPANPPAPERVVSQNSQIVLVGPQELYATPTAITGAAGELSAKGSFITLTAGAACGFDATLVKVVPQAVQPTDAKGAARLQSLHAAVNVADATARGKAREEKGNEQFNAERNLREGVETDKALELYKQDVAATVNDYATFSDCHRNTELVMGSEDEQALIETAEGGREKLPSLGKAEARSFAEKSADPAALGAYAWLAAAIPSFPARLEAGMKEAKIEIATSPLWANCATVVASIRGSIVSKMSINDPTTRAAALQNPEYPKELWRLYQEITDNVDASDMLAILYGVNQGLNVSVGDGLSVINDATEKQAADVAVEGARKRQKDAQATLADDSASEEAKQAAQADLTRDQEVEQQNTKWNFHWVPVVMTDGDDFVALENAAGDDADVNRFDTYRWRFKMFGPQKTLHGESRADPHTTKHYLTIPFERADVAAGTALDAELLAPKSTSTVALHGALVNRARKLSPPVIAVTERPKGTPSKTLKSPPMTEFWRYGTLEREGRDAFVEALEKPENQDVLHALTEEVERREQAEKPPEEEQPKAPAPAPAPPPPAPAAGKGGGLPSWKSKQGAKVGNAHT